MEIQPIDEVKAQLGRAATFTWLGSGAVLFIADGGVGSLLSVRAVLFLGIGMFVSAALVGLASYKLFLKLADKAALAANPEEAREAVLGSFRRSRIACVVLGLVFVFWIYASFFWY